MFESSVLAHSSSSLITHPGREPSRCRLRPSGAILRCPPASVACGLGPSCLRRSLALLTAYPGRLRILRVGDVPALEGRGFLPESTRSRSRRAALRRSKVRSISHSCTSGKRCSRVGSPGQEPPGATALEDVEDRVEYLTGGVGSRSSSLVGRRDVGL
jgi:hypothetical protein